MEACGIMKDQQTKARTARSAEVTGKSGKIAASRRQFGHLRGNIPIHVDGRRDELAEVDPDLTFAELDWRWAGEGEGERRHLEAGGGQSGRTPGRPYTTGSLSLVTRTSGNQPSRARPIKPHETEPFLAVGTFVQRSQQTPGSSPRTVNSATGHRRAKVKLSSGGQRGTSPAFSSVVSGRACGTPNSQRALYDHFRSPYASPTPSVRSHSAQSQVGGRRSAGGGIKGRMYVSPNTPSPRPNPNVKSPFKHNIRQPTQTQSQEPSFDLKEQTALATYHVHRILMSGKGDSRPKHGGKLLQSGKLKPLYPVSVSGPSIEQCRGILSETRVYTPSHSRTLQNRRRIIAQLKSGDLHLADHLDVLAEGSESVHRVSAASSLEDLAAAGGGEEEGEEGEGEMFPGNCAAMEEGEIMEKE